MENIDSDRVIISYDMNLKAFIYEIKVNEGGTMKQIPAPEGHEIIDEMYQKLMDEGLVLPENEIVFISRACGFSNIISIGISIDHSSMTPFTLGIIYDPNNCESLGCRFYKDWVMRYTVMRGNMRLF